MPCGLPAPYIHKQMRYCLFKTKAGESIGTTITFRKHKKYIQYCQFCHIYTVLLHGSKLSPTVLTIKVEQRPAWIEFSMKFKHSKLKSQIVQFLLQKFSFHGAAMFLAWSDLCLASLLYAGVSHFRLASLQQMLSQYNFNGICDTHVYVLIFLL